MKPRDADEFESFLRQRSVLSRRQSDSIEPPAALDEIVLDRARRAIQAPKPLPRYRAPRWAFPAALAATLLLTLSVALNVGFNLRPRPGSFESHQQVASAPDTQSATDGQPSRDSQSSALPGPSAQTLSRQTGETPSPPDANAAQVRERTNAPEATADGPRERANADQVAALPAASSAKRSQAMSSAKRLDPSRGDPDSWLQHIRKLREAGKTSEADAQLRRFEAAFPGYPTTAAQPGPAQVPK